MDVFNKIKEVFGTQQNLADQLGVDKSSVSTWRARGRIPVDVCPRIYELSDRQIPLYELRPDIYPRYLFGPLQEKSNEPVQ